jgi:hypothetical protein
MNEQDKCRWFDSNLNAYLDGELDREAREKMNEHARNCSECGQKLETMTRLLTMCAELDEGLSVPLEAQAAWRKAIRSEAESRRKTRRVSAWTRSAGWIAAALTLLVASTAALRPVSWTPPVEYSTRVAAAPAEMRSLTGVMPEYGSLEDSATSPDALALAKDGPLEGGADSVLTNKQASTTETGRAPVVVRSASRTIETTAYDTDSQMIDNLVDEYAGYYESDSQSGSPIEPGQSVGRERDMSIRVPSAQLDEFLTGLDVIGNIVFKNQSAQDVSDQYYDTTARLNALKAQREQIERLMETTTDLPGIVELSDRLYDLQAEIDTMEGRIRGWDSKANYAQVSVRMTEVAVRDQVQPVGDSLIERIRTGFFDSVNWLSGFLQDMAVVLAALAPILVILLPLIVLIVVIVKVVRAKKRR